MTHIVTVGFASDGKLNKSLFELIGAAKSFENTELSVVAVGSTIDTNELVGYGVKKVYVVDGLSEYQPESYLNAVLKGLDALKADIILLSGDSIGRELGPRLAIRKGFSLFSDVIKLKETNQGLVVTKPVYGGKAEAEFLNKGETAVVLLRPKAHDKALKSDDVAVEIEKVTFEASGFDGLVRIIEKLKDEGEGVKLEDAKIIVAGGRGVGSKENFSYLEELALVLGGSVGASRAAVDAGWVSTTLQIGQTGSIVAPDLYIAVGISGATQHMAGVSAAKHIVAINTDAEAPIFSFAEYGIVDDYNVILPVLTEKLREILS